MTLQGIIRNRKGRAHAWRVEAVESDPFVGQEYQLWHYSTLMLHWCHSQGRNYVVSMAEGWGSVSDQNGMNTAFRELCLPYYYSRAGGAGIIPLAAE